MTIHKFWQSGAIPPPTVLWNFNQILALDYLHAILLYVSYSFEIIRLSPKPVYCNSPN